MIRSLVRRHQTFIFYVATGIFSGAIYFIALYYLIESICVDYRIAVSIAYAFALTFHFSVNRIITFSAISRSVYAQLARYTVMIGLNYLTTMAIVISMVSFLLASAYTGALAAILFNLMMNYWLSKEWIFHQ